MLVVQGGKLLVKDGQLFNDSAGSDCCCGEPPFECGFCESDGSDTPITITATFTGVTLAACFDNGGGIWVTLVGMLDGPYTLTYAPTLPHDGNVDCFWVGCVPITTTFYSDADCTIPTGDGSSYFIIRLQLYSGAGPNADLIVLYPTGLGSLLDSYCGSPPVMDHTSAQRIFQDSESLESCADLDGLVFMSIFTSLGFNTPGYGGTATLSVP